MQYNANEIKTDLLIRFFGIRRSGNHAVIYWLLNHEKDSFFFNDCNIPLDVQCMLRRLRYPLPFEQKMTIVSWENKTIQAPLYIKNMEATQQKTALIMRDPFNWLASYMKKKWGVNNQLLTLYMEYLREFTGETNHLKDKVCVNYNQWFVDREYRKSITKQLGFNELIDTYLDYVPKEGGGSSFDRFKYRNAARKMDVLNRWQTFKDNERYHKWLKWPGLIEKSKEVWPEETQQFLTRFTKLI